jgi:hypothetical protein
MCEIGRARALRLLGEEAECRSILHGQSRREKSRRRRKSRRTYPATDVKRR